MWPYLLVSLALCTASVSGRDGLNLRARAAGKLYFGTATDNPELSDVPYVAQLKNTSDFGQITVGNAQKWDSSEPAQGYFSYAGGDEIIHLAQSNRQLVRCHTLVWHNQLPGWVREGNFDNATLIQVLESHIRNVVGHYKGQCYSWDVVNEAISDDGLSYRSSIFLDTIGPAYIPIAFKAAAEADPEAKLYYNEFNIEFPSAKTDKAVELARMVQDYGAKIDGIGLQAHLIGGLVPSASALQSNLERFTSLGLEVAYTELDVRIPVPGSAADVSQQESDYANIVASCKNTAGCVGITVWDYSDDHSWVPAIFTGYGSALPFDADKKPKSVYWAILNGWGPKRGCQRKN